MKSHVFQLLPENYTPKSISLQVFWILLLAPKDIWNDLEKKPISFTIIKKDTRQLYKVCLSPQRMEPIHKNFKTKTSDIGQTI